jgi:guanine deaminase
MKRFAIKGDIIYTKTADTFCTAENSYLLCEEGLCRGVTDSLDGEWEKVQIFDYSGKLIMPGFTDLHAHAPQYAYRGMGMDLQLLDWLNTYTFPEEAKYADTAYASRMYASFADELACGPTTSAILFATIHTDSDLLLAGLLERTGLRILLGKVNMDRNSSDALTEKTEKSLSETERFIAGLNRFRNVRPIVTPRFVPSCTQELMTGLGKLAGKYNIPIQSHLDENKAEIQWVRDLHPECTSYTDVYRTCGLLGPRTVMAHCVHMTPDEENLIRESGTFIAHCPQSNVNLCSGVAPAVHYLEQHINIGLGTDIAGGASLNMFRAVSDAIRVSKLRYYFTQENRPLKVSEAFYLATKGGGSFFGKTGSFEDGYELDAIVVDDTGFSRLENLNPAQRAERVFYLSDYRNIKAKFVKGRRIYEES